MLYSINIEIYIDIHVLPSQDKLPFGYDLERIIDDWVLMGFLVGNDFLPNLPNLHIRQDAFPFLYATYMEVLPGLDGQSLSQMWRTCIFFNELHWLLISHVNQYVWSMHYQNPCIALRQL